MKKQESIDVRAWADLLDGCPGRVRAELGLSVERRGGAVAMIAAGVDSLLLNRIFDVDLLSEQDAREVLARYREAGIDRVFAHVPRSRLTAVTEKRLQDLGLSRYHRDWVQLSRDEGDPPAVDCDLEVREATAAHAAELGSVLARGFDMPKGAESVWASLVGRPRWTSYVAVQDGRIAAAGTLYVDGAQGCLVSAATDPDYRRRGAQGALIASRLRRAAERGCRKVHAETGEAVPGEKNTSERNLRRYGFEPIGVHANFAPEGCRW